MAAGKERGGKGAGGRLNRSETVTIRLDPKLNYLCDLAARAHRRTKSSLIEAAVAAALGQTLVDPRKIDPPSRTVADLAEDLWDVDEVERFRRLVAIASHLMSYEEQKIWAVITRTPTFWLGQWQDLDKYTEFYVYNTDPRNLWISKVREHWSTICAIAEGETSEDQLPQMDRMRPKTILSALAKAGSLPRGTT